MEITINEEFKIKLPEDYKPVELPYYHEWIKALRSGTYAQTVDCLKDDYGYCCLGVLSEIQGRLIEQKGEWFDGITELRARDTLDITNPCVAALRPNGRFPSGVSVYYFGDKHFSLTSTNDDNVSFEDIATIIEHVWKPVE